MNIRDLPQTREEILVWALEHSGQNFFGNIAFTNITTEEYLEWVTNMFDCFPDLITFKKITFENDLAVLRTQFPSGDINIELASTKILTVLACHLYNGYGTVYSRVRQEYIRRHGFDDIFRT